MKDNDKLMQDCQSRLAQGFLADDLIAFMHKRNATIIESIKIVKTLFKLPLGEAKQIVASNPVWKDVAKAADQLHEEIETRTVGTARRHVSQKSRDRARSTKSDSRNSKTRT